MAGGIQTRYSRPFFLSISSALQVGFGGDLTLAESTRKIAGNWLEDTIFFVSYDEIQM